MFWLGVCEQFYKFKIDVHIVLIHFVFIQVNSKQNRVFLLFSTLPHAIIVLHFLNVCIIQPINANEYNSISIEEERDHIVHRLNTCR